jgi:predicted permease
MGKLLRRLQYLFHRRQVETDLVEEMEFHRAQKQTRMEQSGMPSRQAEYASRRALGNVTLAREDARAVWIWPWLESVAQDLAYAARSLWRQPGFSLLAGGTLAAAIGLNTSAFTLYSGVAWRPWPVPDSARVFNVVGGAGGNFSHAAFQYLAEHSTTFEGLFAERRAGDNVIGEWRMRTSWVSSRYFSVLHVPMMLGRGFVDADDRIGAPATAVLSYPLWKARFDGDSSIVGRAITIDDVPVTVLGVASQDFSGTIQARVDLWLPLSAAVVLRPNERWVRDELGTAGSRPRLSGVLALAGRLSPGVTVSQAQAELDVLAARFEPGQQPGRGIRLFGTAGAEGPRGIGRTPFIRMFAAVVAVLLLACANVGSLLLARAGTRRREVAVRLSLGASRARLIRQLLTESFVLAFVGGAAGTYLAVYLPRLALEAALGQSLAIQLRPDGPVLAYTLGVCLLSSLLFGLAPAFHATRGSTSAALKDGTPLVAGTRFPLRSLLLSVQVALSVVLLVGAGLLIRGVQRALALDYGFKIDGITVVSFEPPASAYDAARTRAFSLELTREIETMADSSIALAHAVPLGSGIIKGSFRMPGNAEDLFNAVYEVSPGYFGVLGLPIVAGRVFGSADAASRGILVNETLARRFGSPMAAVGQTIASSPDAGWNMPGDLRIVGVVRDIQSTALEDVQPTIYQPISGRTIPHVLTAASPDASRRITALAARIDPRVLVRTAPLSENIQSRLQASRVAATIATSLGVLALALATIGMFGAFAFWVQQRTREIGIRMALGARGPEVVQLVLGSSARAIAIGLVIGLAVSVVASNMLRSSLYGLSTVDPIAYGAVATLLACASLAATYVPARRATRVDPLVALRCE